MLSKSERLEELNLSIENQQKVFDYIKKNFKGSNWIYKRHKIRVMLHNLIRKRDRLVEIGYGEKRVTYHKVKLMDNLNDFPKGPGYISQWKDEDGKKHLVKTLLSDSVSHKIKAYKKDGSSIHASKHELLWLKSVTN